MKDFRFQEIMITIKNTTQETDLFKHNHYKNIIKLENER